MKLKKAACFTDIHFGRKSNSIQHNQDCINFVNWFCDYVKNDPSIDHVVFMGDWHESRNNLNIITLHNSYISAKQLNNLNLPIYFIIGNHDLYFKKSRDVYSVIPFNEFSNFNIIDKPTLIKETHKPVLLCPYLFEEEYEQLTKYYNIPIWMGHFEFKGFIVTGQTIIMPTGPDPTKFNKPKFIFSGHFHKRQRNKNIVYIGNTFPMDFSDVYDIERGLMVFDYTNEEILFENWKDCPKYIRTTLSEIKEEKIELDSNTRVQCIADISLSFKETTELKQQLTEKYNLREFVLTDIDTLNESLTQTEVNTDIEDPTLLNIDHLVLHMLNQIKDKDIDNKLLQEIYKQINITQATHND